MLIAKQANAHNINQQLLYSHYMNMGKRVFNRLQELDWSQAALCSLVPEMDTATLNAMIKRDSKKSKFALEISNALGVNVQWLIDGTGPKFLGDQTKTLPQNPVVQSLIQRLKRLENRPNLPLDLLKGVDSMLSAYEETVSQAAKNTANDAISSAGGKVSSSLTDSSDIFKTAPANTTAPQPDYAALSQMAAETSKKSPL